MNPSPKLLTTSIASVIAASLLVAAPSTAQALTWNDAGTSNTWSVGLGDTNWLPGNVDWVNGGTATFTGTGETVSIGSNLDIGALDFVGAGPYTFNNTGGYTIDFSGTGISAVGSPGQLISSTGVINFLGASSAGNSQITISNQADLHFQGTSTAGSSSLSINSGQIFFEGASSAGSAIIDNQGIIEFTGTATGGTATISNGVVLDIVGNTSGSVSIGSLNNASGGFAGGVYLGDNTLNLGGLTLATGQGTNSLDFELNTPGTSGTITLTGGTFTGAGTGEVAINLSDLVSPGGVVAGTYTLIDWTGFSASGVDLADFVLGPLPAGLVAPTHLEIQGSTLVLVAVPEPATFVMPLVAALGMLWLRRRSTRVAA